MAEGCFCQSIELHGAAGLVLRIIVKLQPDVTHHLLLQPKRAGIVWQCGHVVCGSGQMGWKQKRGRVCAGKVEVD
eukprot:293556-Rhodomonas_salina.3